MCFSMFWWIALGLLGVTQSNDRLQMLGNSLRASFSGVDFPNSVFLLKEGVSHEGVVFAFAAFFRSVAPVRFQIWRQVTENEFTLRAEIPHIPSLDIYRPWGREDIYIESKMRECIHVLPGDRLGVFFEKAPAPVAYTFQPTTPRVLATTLKHNLTAFNVGDTVWFDSLVFPYDLSIAAYIFTDNDTSDAAELNSTLVSCPKGMLIPAYTEPAYTTPSPGGEQGATGASGPIGLQGHTGPQGLRGEHGPQGPQGETGASGPAGPQGMTGAKGERGEPGVTGAPGVPGQSVYYNDSRVAEAREADPFSEPYILGLTVWLLLVSLLLLTTISCLCVHLCRHAGLHTHGAKVPPPYSSPNDHWRAGPPSTHSHDSHPEWMSTMKSVNESAEVVNETITEPDSRSQSPSHSSIYIKAGSTNAASEGSQRSDYEWTELQL